jgi:hypothetical protein
MMKQGGDLRPRAGFQGISQLAGLMVRRKQCAARWVIGGEKPVVDDERERRDEKRDEGRGTREERRETRGVFGRSVGRWSVA